MAGTSTEGSFKKGKGEGIGVRSMEELGKDCLSVIQELSKNDVGTFLSVISVVGESTIVKDALRQKRAGCTLKVAATPFSPPISDWHFGLSMEKLHVDERADCHRTSAEVRRDLWDLCIFFNTMHLQHFLQR